MPSLNAAAIHSRLSSVRRETYALHCDFEIVRKSAASCKVFVHRKFVIGTATTPNQLDFFKTRIEKLPTSQFKHLMFQLGQITEQQASQQYDLISKRLSIEPLFGAHVEITPDTLVREREAHIINDILCNDQEKEGVG